MTTLRTVEEVAEDIVYDLSPESNCGCGGYTVYEKEMPKIIQALTQDRATIHTSLVAAVKEKAHKPWDYYNDIPGEVEMVEVEDLLTIINSIFKE